MRGYSPCRRNIKRFVKVVYTHVCDIFKGYNVFKIYDIVCIYKHSKATMVREIIERRFESKTARSGTFLLKFNSYVSDVHIYIYVYIYI